MKSRNITNLGVEIRFLCVLLVFFLSCSLTSASFTTLVLLSIIQAESSCEKEEDFSTLLQRVLSMYISRK